jgi:hypothetical protein
LDEIRWGRMTIRRPNKEDGKGIEEKDGRDINVLM